MSAPDCGCCGQSVGALPTEQGELVVCEGCGCLVDREGETVDSAECRLEASGA